MAPRGPGYPSPLDAMKNGPSETLLYCICVQPNEGEDKTDLLATVDVDPQSPTYCQIIHRLRTLHPKDELHHSGWNVCSSCYTPKECCNNPVRDKLILPALGSNRIYVVDTGKNPRAPEFHKVIDPTEMKKLNCGTPHTAHCLASGEIMISVMGDKEDNEKCDFVLIDAKTYKMKGTWIKGNKAPRFNYDFWYQPYHDVMISTEWGTPRVFKTGFHPSHLTPEYYGQSLNFFSWSKRELIQSIDLGKDGIAPLEVRFLHNPKESQGYVGCAVAGSIYRFYLQAEGKWAAEKVIHIPPKKILGSDGETVLNGMITDILLSLDDKFLYFSNYMHGDVRQYDISDRSHPKLTGQVFLGGKLVNDPSVKLLEDPELKEPPKAAYIKGKRFCGSPQMIQLSLDGKRLYVTSSIFSPWDKQFYPDLVASGTKMAKIDCDPVNGGMKLDENFCVDFGDGPDGPLLAHEVRYPGGDCTSDIWLAND